jgi:hypothetical protein
MRKEADKRPSGHRRLAGESPAGLSSAPRQAFALVAELDKVVLFIDEVEEIAGQWGMPMIRSRAPLRSSTPARYAPSSAGLPTSPHSIA